MDQNEFLSEIGKARGMEYADLERAGFWIGYGRGIRRGYLGENFGTNEDHVKWWVMADDNDDNRKERGRGYRAGLRCARRDQGYCTRNSFSCETCSLVISGRNCHYNPIIQE